MPEKLLTTAELNAVTDKDVGSILNDGGGLRGRVRKNRAGKISVHFEYKYRNGKQYRTTKVEHWPEHSLADIRNRCGEIKTGLAKGIDPIDARKARKLGEQLELAQKAERDRQELERLALEAATQRTFASAIGQWAKLDLAHRKDGGKEAVRAIEKDVIPLLGDLALIDVKRAMLMGILDYVVDRGARVMANHLFGDLKQFFNFALAREWIQEHPLAGLTKDRIGGRQNERERYLSEKEIVLLKKRLPKANLLRTTELSIWIMLSTCCRVGELSQARWKQVDFKKGEWFIPAGNSKNAKNHTVFLSDFARQKFEELQAIAVSDTYCFPSRDGKSHVGLKSITKQIKDRVRATPLDNRTSAVGTLLLPDGGWTPHDLRRTGATMMGELGVAGDVIDRCLNHIEQNKLKRTYQRHELKAEKRDAWRALGDRISLLLETTDDKVVVGKFKESA